MTETYYDHRKRFPRDVDPMDAVAVVQQLMDERAQRGLTLIRQVDGMVRHLKKAVMTQLKDHQDLMSLFFAPSS